MKFEEKNRMSRKGLVKFFKGLTDLVEKNELVLGGKWIRVDDSVDVEVEYKEKKDRAKLEVEVKWQLRGGTESMEDIDEKEASDDIGNESVSYVKQDVKKSFNSIRAKVATGEVPTNDAVESFIDLNHRFNEISQDQEYEKDMGPYMDLVGRLGEAFKAGKIEELDSLVKELRAAKKSCHKTYRSKK